MIDDNQIELLPETVKDVLERIPLAISHAELLHKEGLLSFRPVLEKTILPSERAELFFVGSLAKSLLPLETIKFLLKTLAPPYRYSLDELYFDWIKNKWRYFPEEKELSHIISEIEDIDELEALRDLIEGKIEEIAIVEGKG